MHYMLSAWWLYILYGLGKCATRLGAVAQILVMTNNIINLRYTYADRRLKKPPDIFCKISHIDQLIAWIPSRLALDLALQGS